MIVCEAAVCLAVLLTGALDSAQMPPINEMPLSVTSFWLFDADGHPVAWGGQADGDPYHYANMQPTSADDAGQVGACIGDWVTLPWTTAVSFVWQGQPMTIACYDAFGDVDYRRPFYHAGYGLWVVPLDILSPVPFHGLVWEWATEAVRVGD